MFACICACHMCAVATEVRVVVRSPGTGGISDCEPPCGCWTLNSGLLQEP